MTNKPSQSAERVEIVYCPMCTHTVQAAVVVKGKRLVVAPGQTCGRCHSALDAGCVIPRERAA